MAQDLLDRFTPLHNQPINNSNVASLIILDGHRALKFPQGLNRAAYFGSVMSSLYNNSGIKVTLVWTMAATAGAVRFDVAFERQDAGVFLYSGASFATATILTTSPPGASLRAVYSSVSFANGAAIDSLAALESYRLQITRRGDLDGVAHDAYLHRVFLQNLT